MLSAIEIRGPRACPLTYISICQNWQVYESHISMRLQRNLTQLLMFTKFGMISRALRFIFCLKERNKSEKRDIFEVIKMWHWATEKEKWTGRKNWRKAGGTDPYLPPPPPTHIMYSVHRSSSVLYVSQSHIFPCDLWDDAHSLKGYHLGFICEVTNLLSISNPPPRREAFLQVELIIATVWRVLTI